MSERRFLWHYPTDKTPAYINDIGGTNRKVMEGEAVYPYPLGGMPYTTASFLPDIGTYLTQSCDDLSSFAETQEHLKMSFDNNWDGTQHLDKYQRQVVTKDFETEPNHFRHRYLSLEMKCDQQAKELNDIFSRHDKMKREKERYEMLFLHAVADNRKQTERYQMTIDKMDQEKVVVNLQLQQSKEKCVQLKEQVATLTGALQDRRKINGTVGDEKKLENISNMCQYLRFRVDLQQQEIKLCREELDATNKLYHEHMRQLRTKRKRVNFGTTQHERPLSPGWV